MFVKKTPIPKRVMADARNLVFFSGLKRHSSVVFVFMMLLLMMDVPSALAVYTKPFGEDNVLLDTTPQQPYKAFPGQVIQHVKFVSQREGCIVLTTKSYRIQESIQQGSSWQFTRSLGIGPVLDYEYQILPTEPYTAPTKPGLYKISVPLAQPVKNSVCRAEDSPSEQNSSFVQVSTPTDNNIQLSVRTQSLRYDNETDTYFIPFNYARSFNNIPLQAALTKSNVDYNHLISCQINGDASVANGTAGGDYLTTTNTIGWRELNPDLLKPGVNVNITGTCVVAGRGGMPDKTYTMNPVKFRRESAGMGEPRLVIDDQVNGHAIYKYDFIHTYNLHIDTTQINANTTPWEECELRTNESSGRAVYLFKDKTNSYQVKSTDLNSPGDADNEVTATGTTREYNATCYVHRGQWDEQSQYAGEVMLTRNKPNMVDRLQLAGSCIKPLDKSEYRPGETATVKVTQALFGDAKNVVLTMNPYEGSRDNNLWSTTECPKNGDNVSVSKIGNSCISNFSTNGHLAGDWKIKASNDVLSRKEDSLRMIGSNHELDKNSKDYVVDMRSITIMPEVTVATTDPKSDLPAGIVYRPGDKVNLEFSATLKAYTPTGQGNSQFVGQLLALNIQLPEQLLKQNLAPAMIGNSKVDFSSTWDGHTNTNILKLDAPVPVADGTRMTIPLQLRVMTSEEAEKADAGIQLTQLKDLKSLSFTAKVGGVSADVTKQAEPKSVYLKFGAPLLNADNVYDLSVNADKPLTFGSTSSDQNLLVTFKTHSSVSQPIKATELRLALPDGVVRSHQGDIALNCEKHPGCTFDIDNAWTGKGDNPLIIRSLELQPGETYSVSIPVQLENNHPTAIKPVDLVIGQSPSVKNESPDRIVAVDSVVHGHKDVKVETRGKVEIYELNAEKQEVKADGISFTAHVAVLGVTPTDKVNLTDGTKSWPMTLQSSCEAEKTACFNADIPIPDNPFTYKLTAVVTDQNGGPLASTDLVQPLADDSPFSFALQCKGDIGDAAQQCSLTWGVETAQARVPYLVSPNWMTLTWLRDHNRIDRDLYKDISDTIRDNEYLVFKRKNVSDSGWSPLVKFSGAKVPLLNPKKFYSKDIDVESVLTPGAMLPRYGAMQFYLDQ
ncbi:hypothetical protein [Pantoea sp. App145]|uniref:hypothetical protein n=1 Tax=Pantoea sp. App145 TaxID=3071567 RepID=UPI003A7FC94F